MQFAKFKEEWKSGVYRDPTERIATLCRERALKEEAETIDPVDLRALRRYGLFAMPALIEEVRKRNSKHAFAALAIILEDRETYGIYIRDSRGTFRTREDKLEKLKRAFERLETEQKSEHELAEKISDALAE